MPLPPFRQAKESLGGRLRDLRKDAQLSGRQLAALAGWPPSKISKIEYGKQAPSEADIRVWCGHCRAAGQVPDLIASVRNIESQYVEVRRGLGTGTRRRQDASVRLVEQAMLVRAYDPLIVYGLLQTAEYARAVISQVIEFFEIPNDLEDGVRSRMDRQRFLYKGDRRFHVILGQQALLTMIGGADVMRGQLDRLLAVSSMPSVRLGIIPAAAAVRVLPTNAFAIYDDRLVKAETFSAELTISSPREIAVYARAHERLALSAVAGKDARALISSALRGLADGGRAN
jgi:transcriptional regulator with XRE-family HTH domain